MYAVIKVGGKQYRVEQGQKLLVDRQPHAAGEAFAPVVLMTGGDEVVTDRAKLEGSVSVSVVEHLRGEKIKVFTFKPKRGFKKTRGHRSELTRISVESIGGATKPKRAPARKAEPEAPAEAVVDEIAVDEVKAGRVGYPAPQRMRHFLDDFVPAHVGNLQPAARIVLQSSRKTPYDARKHRQALHAALFATLE